MKYTFKDLEQWEKDCIDGVINAWFKQLEDEEDTSALKYTLAYGRGACGELRDMKQDVLQRYGSDIVGQRYIELEKQRIKEKYTVLPHLADWEQIQLMNAVNNTDKNTMDEYVEAYGNNVVTDARHNIDVYNEYVNGSGNARIDQYAQKMQDKIDTGIALVS